MDEKTYANIGSKPLHTIFDKADGYIRKYDTTKYLVLFHSDEKYERIFDWIRYLIMLKSTFKECIICHYWYFKDLSFNHICNRCHDNDVYEP